jgi:hypothetical protein
MRRRTALLAAGLVATASTVFLTDAESTPVAAQETAGAEINGCHGTGTIGLFSSHSNEQQCVIGFYVCVGTDVQSYPARDGLPAGAIGVIMMPWGEQWHTTNGNYGYVGNVCNGTAGIANVITYASPNLWDSFPLQADPSFASHMRLIQQQCSGRCEARLFSYYVGLQLWSDNSLHIRDLNHQSLEYRLMSFYLANGPIYWDGYTVNTYGQGTAMGAAGFQAQMSQTVLAENEFSWEEFDRGVTHKAPEIVGELLKTIAEIIFIALW